MTPLNRSVSFACSLLWIASCGGPPSLSLRPATRSFTANDYNAVYDRWTRSSDPYDVTRFEDVLHATATFESWEFRWAYVVRYADDFSLTTDQRTEMLRTTLDDAREHHRFYLTMVGSNFRQSDLTSERSAWRVLLIDDRDAQVTPIELEKVARPSVAERTYFPSTRRQRLFFRIVFPAKNPDGSSTIRDDATFVLLRLTGPNGTVDLRWDLLPQRTPRSSSP